MQSASQRKDYAKNVEIKTETIHITYHFMVHFAIVLQMYNKVVGNATLLQKRWGNKVYRSYCTNLTAFATGPLGPLPTSKITLSLSCISSIKLLA